MWRASFEHGIGIIEPNTINSHIHFLLHEVVPHNKVRVVKQGGTIVGFMATQPDTVSQLYVRVQSIGQGIGSHLLGFAKAESAGSLCLYTFAQNSNARRFYEHHGFRELERESENMYKLEAIKYRWQRRPREA
jgi:putative acetyltransferase